MTRRKKNKNRKQLPTVYPDADPENADWPKRTDDADPALYGNATQEADSDDQEETKQAERIAVGQISNRAAAMIQRQLDEARARGHNPYGLDDQPKMEDVLEERMRALRRDAATQAGREKGGRIKHSKRKCPAIDSWLLGQLSKKRTLSNQALVDRFIEQFDSRKSPIEMEYQKREANGGRPFVDYSRSQAGRLSRSGFDRKITWARKQLGISRRSSSRAT